MFLGLSDVERLVLLMLSLVRESDIEEDCDDSLQEDDLLHPHDSISSKRSSTVS